jgi:hypothetical protein
LKALRKKAEKAKIKMVKDELKKVQITPDSDGTAKFNRDDMDKLLILWGRAKQGRDTEDESDKDRDKKWLKLMQENNLYDNDEKTAESVINFLANDPAFSDDQLVSVTTAFCNYLERKE